MKTIGFCQAAVVLAASTLMLPAAHAAASASASLTNVQIQLFDLDPLDGITPGIIFVYDGIQGSGWATTPPTPYSFNGLAGSAGSGTAGSGAVWSSSAVTPGNFNAPGPGPDATASATASGLSSGSYGIAWVLGTDITVTAKTLVVVTATAHASASALLGESAGASAVIQLSDGNGNYSIGQAYQYINTNGTHYENVGPLAAQAVYVNLSPASVSGVFLGAYAETSAYGVTSVPEPATYGLMVAGLLAVGAVARRRNGR